MYSHQPIPPKPPTRPTQSLARLLVRLLPDDLRDDRCQQHCGGESDRTRRLVGGVRDRERPGLLPGVPRLYPHLRQQVADVDAVVDQSVTDEEGCDRERDGRGEVRDAVLGEEGLCARAVVGFQGLEQSRLEAEFFRRLLGAYDGRRGSFGGLLVGFEYAQGRGGEGRRPRPRRSGMAIAPMEGGAIVR